MARAASKRRGGVGGGACRPPLRPSLGSMACGLTVAILLAGQVPASAAPGVPPSRQATAAEQRQWLLTQLRLGQAAGRATLVEDTLARLQLLSPDDPATLAALMEAQLSRQKYDEAERWLVRLRAIAPASAGRAQAERLWRAYRGDERQQVQQARMLSAAGRTEEALAIYRKLFGDDPPGLELGIDYWRLRAARAGDRRLAADRLAALDQRYPGSVVLRQTLSRLLIDSGRGAEAVRLLHRMADEPETRDLAARTEMDYLKGLPVGDASVAAWRAYLARYPDFSQIDDARAIYDDQRKRVSDPAWRAGYRGLQWVDEGRDVEAEPLLRRAIRAYPGDPQFLGGLGLALMHQGRRADAITWFERARAQGASDGSENKWVDLIASTRYWMLLGQAQARLDAGDLEQARKLYGQARRQRPDDANARLGLADVALAGGDRSQALAELQAARQLAPGDDAVVRGFVRLYADDPDRLEAYLQALPAARRARYADDLRRIRRNRLEQQADQAKAGGDAEGEVRLLAQAAGLAPDDPWLAYRWANALHALERDGEADAAFAQLLEQAGDDPQARYAHALYLSATDRAAAAQAELERIPRDRRSDGMVALAERLQREQTLAQARRLHAEGQDARAEGLLASLPIDDDTRLLLAGWAMDRRDYARAQTLYADVLAATPNQPEARIGRVEAWLAAGRSDEARRDLADINVASMQDDADRLRRVADAWLTLGEPVQAGYWLQTALGTGAAPEPRVRRDLARLLARTDAHAALDEYALAMRDEGLLRPDDAMPRDDRALTRASREQDADDWLRRSLRSDVDALYRRENPTLTVFNDASRRSDGTPGISRLRRDTRIAHLDIPLAGGTAFARIEQFSFDAGRFQGDADGIYVADFGTCLLAVTDAGGQAFTLPGCSRDRHQRLSTGAAPAVGWRNAGDTLSFDLGHSPSGYPVGDWYGGVDTAGDLGPLYWSATASRRPMTNSLLSQAGAIDPRTGIRWGGVTATGITFGLGYDQGGSDGVWSSWSAHRLVGENVAGNRRARAMAGWYHKFVQRADLRLDAGVSAMYWRYAKDLGGYSLGQGGYYSPQRYASLGLPVSFAWRNADWSVRLDASASVSASRSDAIARYPYAPAIREALARLHEEYGDLEPIDAGSADSRSTGTGYKLSLAVERRLSDHFVLGAATTLQHSQDYSPNAFQLYLRYTARPWQGNLPLPVTPLTPYGEFR